MEQPFDNLPQPSPTEPTITPEPTSKFKSKFSIWSLVIVGVVLGGYLIVSANQNLWPFRVDEAVISSVPVRHVNNGDAPTWKTYRNEKYGFEIKYPSDWIFESDVNGLSLDSPENHKSQQNGCGEGCPIDIIIAFDENSKNLTAKQYYGSDGIGIVAFDNPEHDREIKIDGKIAYELYPITGLSPGELVIIPVNGIFIRFDTKLITDKGQIFDQILSTFKFTK